MKVKLVGGPLDGQEREVAGKHDVICFPCRVKPECGEWVEDCSGGNVHFMKECTYKMVSPFTAYYVQPKPHTTRSACDSCDRNDWKQQCEVAQRALAKDSARNDSLQKQNKELRRMLHERNIDVIKREASKPDTEIDTEVRVLNLIAERENTLEVLARETRNKDDAWREVDKLRTELIELESKLQEAERSLRIALRAIGKNCSKCNHRCVCGDPRMVCEHYKAKQ